MCSTKRIYTINVFRRTNLYSQRSYNHKHHHGQPSARQSATKTYTTFMQATVSFILCVYTRSLCKNCPIPSAQTFRAYFSPSQARNQLHAPRATPFVCLRTQNELENSRKFIFSTPSGHINRTCHTYRQ